MTCWGPTDLSRGFVVCSVPVNQPLDALVSWFEEEVRTEAGEEERDAGVQLLVDLFGLYAALYSQRGPAEQRVLELQKRRFNSQQLFQPCAAWRTKVSLLRSETAQRCKSGRFRRGVGLTEGIEGAFVHGGSIFGVKEEGGDLPAGQQVGVTLRQRKPLQLMSQ